MAPVNPGKACPQREERVPPDQESEDMFASVSILGEEEIPPHVQELQALDANNNAGDGGAQGVTEVWNSVKVQVFGK